MAVPGAAVTADFTSYRPGKWLVSTCEKNALCASGLRVRKMFFATADFTSYRPGKWLVRVRGKNHVLDLYS